MAKVTVNISIASDQPDRFAEIVQSLAAAGLDVTQALPSIGIVSGEIDGSKIPDLRQIDGVAAVEVERAIGISSP